MWGDKKMATDDEQKYLAILEKRVKDTWSNWSDAEKKAASEKASYDAAIREMMAFEKGLASTSPLM